MFSRCEEREFIQGKFKGPVVEYPFRDHNAPKFEQIMALCEDVKGFLDEDKNNIVAINCKAGKGRTGVMVCACLLFTGVCHDSEEALNHYASERTNNGKGVTIPSQRRYVHYYGHLLKTGLVYRPKPLVLRTFVFGNIGTNVGGIYAHFLLF
ncbi:unnamed protein product, partial [Protopolystoma xenopodis]